MMISFSPFEPEPVPLDSTAEPISKIPPTSSLNTEDTECNYLVMFFITGVFILACVDSAKR